MLRICGLRERGSLWISGLEEEVGAGFAPTLAVLRVALTGHQPLKASSASVLATVAKPLWRMLLLVLTGRGVVLENACRQRDTLLNSCG